MSAFEVSFFKLNYNSSGGTIPYSSIIGHGIAYDLNYVDDYVSPTASEIDVFHPSLTVNLVKNGDIIFIQNNEGEQISGVVVEISEDIIVNKYNVKFKPLLALLDADYNLNLGKNGLNYQNKGYIEEFIKNVINNTMGDARVDKLQSIPGLGIVTVTSTNIWSLPSNFDVKGENGAGRQIINILNDLIIPAYTYCGVVLNANFVPGESITFTIKKQNANYPGAIEIEEPIFYNTSINLKKSDKEYNKINVWFFDEQTSTQTAYVFYLYNDSTPDNISFGSINQKRISPVVERVIWGPSHDEEITDADAAYNEALQTFSQISYDNEIEFEIKKSNQRHPFYIGEKVDVIYKNQTIKTVVTAVNIKNESVVVKLGKQRNTLTATMKKMIKGSKASLRR